MNLPELATRRRVTVGMLTLTMVLFGLIGLSGLKVNLLPDLSYPTLTVRTEYEGAAPLEIENLISQPVHLRVDALPDHDFDGIVARIAPVVDAASGTFRATCEFRDSTRTLKPGMFGRIDVVYDQRHDALVVPRSALVEEDGESAVFVIEPAPPKKSDDKAKDKKAAPKAKAGEAVAAEKKPDVPLVASTTGAMRATMPSKS